MVAEACFMTPTPCKLGTVAVAHRSQDGPAPKLPCHGISSQDEAKGWQHVKQEDEHETQQRDRREDQEINFLDLVKREDEEDQADPQSVDDQDEEEALEEEEEECSSEDRMNNNKGQGSTNWRRNSLKKMNYGKMWIESNVLLVTTGLSVVSLSAIEEAYQKDCRKEYQEPLATSVLARLIHQQFPEASKSRLGSRGNQKIHYMKLQLKSNSTIKQHQVNGSTLPATKDKAKSQMPGVNLEKQDKQGKGKIPASSVKPKDTRDPSPDEKDGGFHGFREALVSAAMQPLPREENEDEEGCEHAANRLMQVVNSLKSRGKMEMLLEVFAHSSTCESSSCSPLCRMFRRVRRHVVNARHACHVMHLYSALLKSHVRSCKNNNCGMTACPALRASQQVKRGRDDELQQENIIVDHQQDGLHHTNKKFIRQGKRPSNLIIRISSPTSSLPDSDASTPSPTLSPTDVLPTSPVRMFPVPPNGMNIVPKIVDQAAA